MTDILEVLPANRLALSEQVVSQLEALILGGKVEVGARLPAEGALARRFGVSRPVIREALALLRDRGLTETVSGSGTYVRRPDGDHLTDVLLRHMHFGSLTSSQLIESIYEARTAVEVTAARLASGRRRESDIRLMSSRLEEMRMQRDDAVTWIAADMGFHLAVVDAARSPFLSAFLMPMTRIIEQSISVNWHDPAAVSAGLMSHEALFDAIVSQDGDRAAQAMLEHLRDAKYSLSTALVLPGSTPRGPDEGEL